MSADKAYPLHVVYYTEAKLVAGQIALIRRVVKECCPAHNCTVLAHNCTVRQQDFTPKPTCVVADSVNGLSASLEAFLINCKQWEWPAYVLTDADDEQVGAVFGSALVRLGLAGVFARRSLRDLPWGFMGVKLSSPATIEHLSRREKQVMYLIARGLTNYQIAQELYLSEATIKDYVQRVMDKLGLKQRTRAAVAAFANQSGLA